MLRIENVSKNFRAAGGGLVEALAPVSLAVSEGEFVSILGASGCGKSTLLRLIAGLEEPTSGSVKISSVPSQRRRIGFVFQDPVLLPWLSALANIRFPLDTSGTPRPAADARARELIELVGLEGFEAALPHQLSGGMRQRVSIARALSYDPPLLLMDEPFGALDFLTRERLNDELLRIWQATGKTVLFVTHSVDEAAYLSDRVVVMAARPGRIRAIRETGLPRPRGEAVKLDPRFHQLLADLRQDLR